MTPEDKIRDEKLQYDINIEAAKISVLSSGKINKYEYLTGEEVLPSNQQQIIEHAKFSYSPLGKAFEKQTKTIDDQGKKQFDALADLKEIKPKEANPRKTKPGEYSDYFLNEFAIILSSFKPINFYDLTYKFKDSSIPPVKFIEFKGRNAVFKDIHDGNIILEDVENEQKELKAELGYIKQGNPRNRSEVTLKIFISQGKKLLKCLIIMIINNYSKQEGSGLKTLTPKQMLQRLPIAMAQIKADNNSESLLNEIRQIIYSLYKSKEITKKVYNNIIK